MKHHYYHHQQQLQSVNVVERSLGLSPMFHRQRQLIRRMIRATTAIVVVAIVFLAVVAGSSKSVAAAAIATKEHQDQASDTTAGAVITTATTGTTNTASLLLLYQQIVNVPSSHEEVETLRNQIQNDILNVPRHQRFPSPEQRIQLYMSNWYIPPCNNSMIDNNDDDRNTSSLLYVRYQEVEEQAREEDEGELDHHQLQSRRSRMKQWSAYTIYESNSTNSSSYTIDSMIRPDTLFAMDRSTMIYCSIRPKNKTPITTKSKTKNKKSHNRNSNNDNNDDDDDEHESTKDQEDQNEQINPEYHDRITFLSNMHMYCEDIVSLLLPHYDQMLYDKEQQESSAAIHPTTTFDSRASSLSLPPILIQFGDLLHSHIYEYVNIPHFKKFRMALPLFTTDQKFRSNNDGDPDGASLSSTTIATTATSITLQSRILDIQNTIIGNTKNIDLNTYNMKDACYSSKSTDRQRFIQHHPYQQPIVWKLASSRHYGYLDAVVSKDKLWEDKKDMAIFRGQLTGSRHGYDKNLSPYANCIKLSRCKLVYNHYNSTYINAMLTSTRGRLPDTINDVPLITKSCTIRHLLRYKGIIMLEGNDVASGLKWALLSNSIVLMPIPKFTSYAMEELLIPWKHYVPILPDASDVEQKMKWILQEQNVDLVQDIIAASTLWMQDLMYHPDTISDNQYIQKEMIRRYQNHFLPL